MLVFFLTKTYLLGIEELIMISDNKKEKQKIPLNYLKSLELYSFVSLTYVFALQVGTTSRPANKKQKK